jgi:AcrR family transcriptional regulator
MKNLLSNIKIKVNSNLYIKDPETSALGRKIISESIAFIDETGFDNFTFKKLGERIGSNESSIYRYFENKHMLLVYLSSWYWSWMEYRIVFATTNVPDPMEKLKIAITLITEKIVDDEATDHINEAVLNRIIITEFTKTFLTKEVDEENKEGFFMIYKQVIYRLIEMIRDVNSEFPYSKSLASGIVEGALHQHFLKDHLKTITDCSDSVSPADYYKHLISLILKK